MSNIVLAAGGDDGYQISRSVRLRSSATASFTRTPAAAGNRKKWTYSGWIKRGQLGINPYLYSSGGGSTPDMISIGSLDQINLGYYNGSYIWQLTSTAVLRDPSAWYHIVVVWDTAQATASNRVKLFINGVQVTSFTVASYPSLNYDSAFINTTASQSIGGVGYFDGYMTEVNFIDGQALDASSFGETDAVTGVWKPKKYAGTYGTNGFYLNFSDNSAATAAAIGKDSSGNGNNWTPNNISVTAGATYDSMIDTPTPYADGGNGRGNYCVINPIDRNLATVSDGNLRLTGTASTNQANGSMAFPISGKWYFEATISSNSNTSNGLFVGIASPTRVVGSALSAAGTYGVYGSAASAIYSNGSTAASGLPVLNSTYTYQVAVDVDNGKAWIGYNTGSSQFWYNSTGGTTGDPATGANPTFTVALAGFLPLFQADSASGYFWYANFGQRPFSYTPPTGFKALNTQNLPDSTILKPIRYFDVATWSGDGTSGRVITTSVDTVDLAWVKKRNGIDDHRIANSVLGGNKHLKSNATDAESTGTTVIQAFSGNTFTVGSDNSVNASGGTYVGWQWKKGATQGFDIVTYTGNGTVQSVPHNLGATPAFYMVKSRSVVVDWVVNHKSLTTNQYLVLNQTVAIQTAASVFNGGARTLTTFDVGVSGGASATTNQNGATYVAYLFSEVAGFSKFGSYTGNGAPDGPFVYCGFRPRYILVKNANDGTTNWIVVDTSTAPYNATAEYSIPNSSASSPTGTLLFDILSNGFKCRLVSTGANGSGNTMIFAAFAENPFKNSLAR